jgi:formylglycine-generating enzyme required for sulfatase activity/photosystem II stability/assembly factor-like uncharacterized protein
MKRIWGSALLLSFLTLGCAKGKPVPWTSVASSADGSKLVAVGDGHIHTSTDSGATWTKSGPWGYWTSVASSTDGVKLVAVSNGADQDHGNILISADSGVSWTQKGIDQRNWVSVASSSNGSRLAAVGNDDEGHSYVYTSTDSGVSWTQRSPWDFSGSWTSVASSADGTKLVAVGGDSIYTSADSGVSWTREGVSINCTSVASSADGSKLVAVGGGGYVYTSTDSGVSWRLHLSGGVPENWTSVASSADGTKLVAVAGGGFIYTSTSFGTTWTQTAVSDNWTSVASSTDGNKLVALTSAGSIYASTNSGVAWTKLSGGSGGGHAGVPDAHGSQPDVPVGGTRGGAGGIGGVGGSTGGGGGMGGSVGADAGRPDAPGAQPDVPTGGTRDTASSVGGSTGGGAGDAGVPDAPEAQPDAPLGGSGGAGVGGASGTGGFNPFGGGGSGKGGAGGGAGGAVSSGGTGASGGAGGSAGSTSAPPSLAVWVADKTIGGTGQITLNLRIDNKTAQSVDMSTVTLRYWYQDEGLGTALLLAADYVSIGLSNQGTVTGKAVAASPAVPGADHYLELSFTGTLAAQGDKATNDQFNVRVTAHTLGYTGVVNVTNDYSYDGGAVAVYEQKITLHDRSGKVIWGVVPGTSGPADAAVDTSVSGDAGLPDAPAAPDAEPDVPISGTGGAPATGGTTTTGGTTASGGTTTAGGTTASGGSSNDASSSNDAGGSNDASSSDGAATAPPSCSGLAATCGPLGNEDCCTSLLVPGGTFYRGYDSVDYTDPNYPATVADFYLDKYEITVGRFRQFVNAGMGTQASPPGSGAGAHPLIAGSGWDSTWNTNLPLDTASLKDGMKCDSTFQTWTDTAVGNESRPQNCMDWYTAFAFCAWDGGRLPTEAEWSYAAAGGSEQRAYPWSVPPTSATIDDSYAVYCGSSCDSSQNVGSKSPKGDGKWGQSDLAGNLWEWTLDWRGSYQVPCSNCADLIDPAADSRVIRGGRYYGGATQLWSSYRGSALPVLHNQSAGSRCARTGSE